MYDPFLAENALFDSHPYLGPGAGGCFLFFFGGVGLIGLLYELVLNGLGLTPGAAETEQGVIIFEVVEYVHTFLVGTVLYITAMGLFQLFIKELDLPGWLKIDSTEELETNLIGVTVVVLAVNFMGAIFAGSTGNLLQYGAGIALPIAALGLFVGLRTWSVKISRETDTPAQNQKPAAQEITENE